MINNKIKINKIVTSILFIIVIGVLIGILSTNKLEKINITISNNNEKYLKIFLNSFSLNFWYLFLIWFIGMIPLGFIFDYLIIFVKSFTIGITLGICLKSSAIFGIKEFITFAILELIIVVPSLIFLGNKSISFSLNGKNNLSINRNDYFNVLIKITIITIIYAILSCLKMTFMEVK